MTIISVQDIYGSSRSAEERLAIAVLHSAVRDLTAPVTGDCNSPTKTREQDYHSAKALFFKAEYREHLEHLCAMCPTEMSNPEWWIGNVTSAMERSPSVIYETKKKTKRQLRREAKLKKRIKI